MRNALSASVAPVREDKFHRKFSQFDFTDIPMDLTPARMLGKRSRPAPPQTPEISEYSKEIPKPNSPPASIRAIHIPIQHSEQDPSEAARAALPHLPLPKPLLPIDLPHRAELSPPPAKRIPAGILPPPSRETSHGDTRLALSPAGALRTAGVHAGTSDASPPRARPGTTSVHNAAPLARSGPIATHEPSSTCALLDALCARAPLLGDIRKALRAPKVARFNNAVALFTSAIRVAYAAAFLEAREALKPESDSDRADIPIQRAICLRTEALEFLALTRTFKVRKQPHVQTRLASLAQQIRSVTGPGPEATGPLPVPEPAPRSPLALTQFEHASHMCVAALSAGWEPAECTTMWARVQLGSYSSSGKSFFPGPRTPQSSAHDWSSVEARLITRAPGESPVAVYVSHGQICAIVSESPLRGKTRKSSGAKPPSLTSMPDFIALPRDAAGRPIIPKSRVTALVEAQLAWHQELGSLDSLSSTIVRGLLVMPKLATPSQRKELRNHPSWEDDPAAQAALGPIIAKWLAQGVLEYVQWDDRQPVLLQPCGAVPKGSAPFYRLITDARFGNTMYSDWGVTYSSAADLSSAVHHRDFTWSADLQDAYHLSVFAGCGGQLRPCRRPVIHGDGTLSWTDGFIVGCGPDTCLGGCDKDMSGLSISGHIFRFAACQFGQKTAGSPLNALVMSVAKFFARLPDPVHVAAWVDDLHFSMRTPPHPPCRGHVGGCPVCHQAYNRAVQAEALWRDKAKALNLPLSDGKGHSVAQGGPFTGVHIDTFLGRYSMLADKLSSMRATFAALVNAESSTPRLLAQARGKAAHYGCAVQHLAAICPALTQAIHQSETSHCLPPPTLDEEARDAKFDWDKPLITSARTRAALKLMLHITDQLGAAGQPMWPPSPAASLGNFRRGTDSDTSLPTITALSHCSPAGWGWALRTHSSKIPILLHGPWTLAPSLLNAAWMAQPSFEASGAPRVRAHQHALAALFGFHETSRRLDLTTLSLIIQTPCDLTISSMQRGSSSDPVLQDISMLFQAACLDLRTQRPAFLKSPESIIPAPLPDSERQLALMDSSTPTLKQLVRDLARHARHTISLDLFASSANRICERYFSATAEPDSEGVDALRHPGWAWSHCHTCQRLRPEFVFLYPPFALVRKAIGRAFQDQAQGIAVLPYAPSAPWWHTIISAALPVGRADSPAIKLRCGPTCVQNQSNANSGHFIAVIRFDFWQGNAPRPAPCIHTHKPRPRDTTWLDQDLSDIAALDSLIAELHQPEIKGAV